MSLEPLLTQDERIALAGIISPLTEAGWMVLWMEADYHWCMRAPDGSMITYVEGDIFRGNQRPLPHGEAT